LHSGTFWLL